MTEAETDEDYGIVKAELSMDDEPTEVVESQARNEDLPIQTAADFVESELTVRTTVGAMAGEGTGKATPRTGTTGRAESNVSLSRSPAETTPERNTGVKRLSDKEVKEISQDLYRGSDYLTEEEKLSLLKQSENVPPTASTPIVPPKKT
ncbi:MAG: hypothetical protein D6800_09555, partial [Candidatus Zixiibacteriota bacterium]